MNDMRLGDLDALKVYVKHTDLTAKEKVALLFAIAEAPTIDAVLVVHGRWIFGTTMNREWMKCSECLVSQTPTGVFSYCPNCGARMDGDG